MAAEQFLKMRNELAETGITIPFPQLDVQTPPERRA